MPARNKNLAPFLSKLDTICRTIDPDVGHWSGKQFEVTNPDAFFKFLSNFFEGSPRTFFRQLSYFRFKRRDLRDSKGFSFSHDNFTPDEPNRLYLIKRCTRPWEAQEDDEENFKHRVEDTMAALNKRVEILTEKMLEVSTEMKLLKESSKRFCQNSEPFENGKWGEVPESSKELLKVVSKQESDNQDYFFSRYFVPPSELKEPLDPMDPIFNFDLRKEEEELN